MDAETRRAVGDASRLVKAQIRSSRTLLASLADVERRLDTLLENDQPAQLAEPQEAEQHGTEAEDQHVRAA